MGSPSALTPDGSLTPMEIGAIRQRNVEPDLLSNQQRAILRDLDSRGVHFIPLGRGGNTARRSRPGPSGNRRNRGRG
jgi:hypothetical protein